MKFIELTVKNGNKILVNVALVSEIYDMKEAGTQLYFDSNSENQTHVSVVDKYDDIKQILLAV